ncbi:hypothetical protein SBRCBS47491_009825 [Sporothrix bragantina]|uniref:Beta-xylosidase C-terminal Concanavalin A-like domain-containing protein n=1 Tax=Sporothrix bragantina TaxID=671064 RepID=A0ABP0CXX0_9PEZI
MAKIVKIVKLVKIIKVQTAMAVYRNPVLSGFYPDPSCIRVGDTFYLINSSFQFFPGLPIHASTNLVDWALVGHAICRPSQLDLSLATTRVNNAARREYFTAGLYAPTIRYHAGTFYIVCTNMVGVAEDPSAALTPHNFLITCKDLHDAASYSDPVYFDFHGIDPSLLFDDDGRVYLQGSYIIDYRKHPATVIRQAEFDPQTGRLLSEFVDIWTGTGGKVPEGPHLYKTNGMYWLLIAEGGTHAGHCVTMARSASPWGPYEPCKDNPLVAGRAGHTVQCVGHAELVEDGAGHWWALLLARREHGDAFSLGRETYLVPATWTAGEFPALDSVELLQQVATATGTGRGRIGGQPNSADARAAAHVVTLSSPHTVFLRTPALDRYVQRDADTMVLHFTAAALGCGEGSPVFLGERQTALNSTAQVTLDLTGLPDGSHSGLSLYKDTYRHVSLDVDGRHKRLSLASQHPGQPFAYLHPVSLSRATSVRLTVSSTALCYTFAYSTHDGDRWAEDVVLGSVPSSAVSGDDFTGPVYGIYAAEATSGAATFTAFSVTGSDG